MGADDARLQLERERFEYEKLRNEAENRSSVRRLSVGLGVAGTVISLVTGGIQFWIGNVRAQQERDLSLGKVLLEQGPKIYSKDAAERAYVIEVIQITSPNKKVTDTILARFASATPDVDKIDMIRALGW